MKKASLVFGVGILLFLIAVSSASAYTDDGSAFYCTNCGDCVDALNNNTFNTVYLNASIDNALGTCIDNPVNFTDKVFDCQGTYYIDGDGYEDSDYAIQNGNTTVTHSNVTVQNCTITEFGQGIRYASGTAGNILNNNVTDCGHAIYVIYSTEILIDNNDLRYNHHNPALMIYAQNNTATNNVIWNNTFVGLQLWSNWSTGNTINSNSMCGNLLYDISDNDSNTGDNNRCDKPKNWDDAGDLGCTFACGGEPAQFNCTYNMAYTTGRIQFQGSQDDCNDTWNVSYTFTNGTGATLTGTTGNLASYIPLFIILVAVFAIVAFITGDALDAESAVKLMVTLIIVIAVVFLVVNGVVNSESSTISAFVENITEPIIDVWNNLTYGNITYNSELVTNGTVNLTRISPP